MSVLLRPPVGAAPDYAAGVQLAAGIAIAETISPLLSRPVELVWPNDVFCVGLKMAGVLVEGETTGQGLDFLVCGIGLNVNQARADFDPALGGVGGSLRMLAGERQDRHALLVRLLFTLESWERVARGGDGRALAERFVSLSPTSVGCRTQVRVVEGLVEGESAGVTAQGALVLKTPAGVREIVVGELERAWRKQ
jgi:BirA family biotin operon repressor/biotin-[acetyl-CoA-carboxylase] ligase